MGALQFVPYLSPSVFGEEDTLFLVCSGCRLFRVRICALCAASSTGRGRFHLQSPGATATQTVGKIKASLFFLAILLLSAWLPLVDDILTQEKRNL